MPEETKAEPATSIPPQPTVSTGATGQTEPQLICLAAAALVVCFFLPWMQVLFAKPSGFDLQKLGDMAYLLWSVPFFGVVTVLACLAKSNVKVAAQITGVIPFAVLIYGFYLIGADLLKILGAGAYLGVFLAVTLLILAGRLKS